LFCFLFPIDAFPQNKGERKTRSWREYYVWMAAVLNLTRAQTFKVLKTLKVFRQTFKDYP
jgi:hypothetical protein